MKYVKFGNSGVDVSRICLGMMSFGQPGPENGLFPSTKDFEEAVKALDIVLIPEQIDKLEAPYQQHPITEVDGYLQF